jgi:hypothetical protein
MDRFRENDNGILVATDVAARGLDIPGVRTVVHYQLPHSAEVSQFFTSFIHILIFIWIFIYLYNLFLIYRFMFIEVEEQLELLPKVVALL